MGEDLIKRQPIENIEYNSSSEGVRFDSEKAILQGSYGDQVSAYRAKRIWIEVLNNYFFLEVKKDFSCSIERVDEHLFSLICSFDTACARYVFWRITNEQAPEAQYIIETAHIPLCESRHLDILDAPDLMPLEESEPTILNGLGHTPNNGSILGYLSKVGSRLKNEIYSFFS